MTEGIITQFEKLKTAVKEIGFETERAEERHYFEGVLASSRLQDLSARLELLLGQAQKEPSAAAKEAVSGFGGINKGQTLYYYGEGPNFIFAMLWPWQDGEHITLKMACG